MRRTIAERPRVDAIAQAKRVDRRAQRKIRAGITTAVEPHARPDGGRRTPTTRPARHESIQPSPAVPTTAALAGITYERGAARRPPGDGRLA